MKPLLLDQRPVKLPIKTLKEHIHTLIEKYKLTVQWGCRDAIYNVRTGIVDLRNIRTCKDYISDLHEIGHALCPVVRSKHNEFQRIDKFITDIKNIDINFPMSSKKITRLTKQLDDNINAATKLGKDLEEKNWLGKAECLAWKYAYRNSLIWNYTIEAWIYECMRSHWASNPELTKLKMQELLPNYMEWSEKYVIPIFK